MDQDTEFVWQDRWQYIAALLCLCVGKTTYTSLPLLALSRGALGYIFGYTLAHICLGIPLLYMELFVSQFTARDCLEVWTLRPCLSHIGYVQILWQLFFIVYNHAIAAFVIHYLLISFEEPVPYSICGKWAKKDCGILKTNFTVNQDCIKNYHKGYRYCKKLRNTFPEYQYWRFYLFGQSETYMYIAWRICLASGIACVIIFLACFRRKTSLKWFLGFLVVFPFAGYIIIMIGSMLQPGLVTWYAESIDVNFEKFKKYYSTTNIIQQVLFSLSIGSGASFNMGASTSFRAPVYSNVVISVTICTAITVFAVFTMAMLPCPFANVYGILPSFVIEYELAIIIEKIPMLLRAYDYGYSYLILIFSTNGVLILGTNIVTIHHMLEMLAKRFQIVPKYPGCTCFIFVTVLFFLTIPLLSSEGIHSVLRIRKTLTLLSTFLAAIECYIFILWYGLEKFSEDVHFMQGIRPGCILKTAWILGSVLVTIVFFRELYEQSVSLSIVVWSTYVSWYVIFFAMGCIVLLTLVRLAVAAFRKKFRKYLGADASWGPRDLILRRSRAMFTAQAMTKEYIYRQYHLQAGVVERQKSSNVRRKQDNPE